MVRAIFDTCIRCGRKRVLTKKRVCKICDETIRRAIRNKSPIPLSTIKHKTT